MKRRLKPASRERACFAFAIAVHLATWMVLRTSRPRDASLLEVPIELTIVSEARVEAAPEPSEAPAPENAAPSAPATHASAGARSERVVAAPTNDPNAETRGANEAQTGDSPDAPGTGRLTLEQLGLGANPFLTHVPEVARPDAGAGDGRRDALGSRLIDRAREASLGLAPDGPVRTELAQATRLSRAPVNGRAVFRVFIGADGVVSRVDVVEYTDTRDVWTEVAEATLTTLKGRRMRMASSTAGAILLVEVTSRLELPSGAAAHVDPGAGTLGGHGDLSDLGARASRVVHSRLLEWTDPG